MGDLAECYKCFSLGPHRCYQRFNAEKKFVCETCGNLKSPFGLKQDENQNKQYYCLWCNKSLQGKEITEFEHLLWCPERKIHSLGEFYKYHCVCAEVAIRGKWLLYK